jgi:RNA polymerase sigma-70 factor (ECF subfamily)
MTVPASNPSIDANFHTTRWSVVSNARGDSPVAKEALSELCGLYYAPVVAFLAREGRSDDAAREIAHEFFRDLLGGANAIGEIERSRGHFRSYLLGALKHFVANLRRAASREKRGGDIEHVAITNPTETSPGFDVADSGNAPNDIVFDRAWALAVVERALTHLQSECDADGRGDYFTELKPWLTPGGAMEAQAASATRLGMTEGAFKVAIHRLRRRYRELVRSEIAQTLSKPGDLDAEMRHLVAALAA